ncbi:hypothetical protein DPMN_086885 [Dreissena polymorpha]|uniref:Uncharacterized protein n=1 Tax=Dreissena polymorpha TaxID=45954 RepID=A0A9D4KRQ0_DREPO|nr:hypothetical protein DPMN_086885 [Dreissena polymorpha]
MYAVQKPVDILAHVNHGRYGKISHYIMIQSAAYMAVKRSNVRAFFAKCPPLGNAGHHHGGDTSGLHQPTQLKDVQTYITWLAL